jgi:uncharacterized protein (DUF2147 family)
MKKILCLFLTAMLLFPLLLLSTDKDEDSIIGLWYTEGGKSKVDVYKKNGKFYGKIIWLKEPNDENGNPKKDKMNPDESKRDRKILGLLILRNFEYDGDKEWDDGKIYNPEDGETYSCIINMSDDGKTLDVRGYIGISLFGKTTVWKRVE